MKTKLKLHLLLLTLLSLSGFTHAQGTAIGYQGRLNDGGSPATGLYDFTFTLFDVDVDGAALAGPVPQDTVPVTNGVFNVSLDFGPDIFSGPARWLEITVRTNGVGDPSLLSPRTPLLPTPYAIFASKAGAVASGTLTADQLNSGGIPPAPGQFLSYDGGNFLWRDPVMDSVWLVNEPDAYYTAGNVGIGGLAGTSKLQITGADALTLTGPGPYLTWHDTITGMSAHISSANGALYYRVPNAAGDVVTAGYADANGSVVRGRIAIEGIGPFITWQDNGSGRSAAISSANGALYYRVPNAAGDVVTAGYVDANGSVVRGRIVVEGNGPFITWSDSGTGKSASISSANGALYYRVPDAAGNVVTAGYVDSNGLVVNGRVSVCTLTIRGGCDLAEPFAMSQPDVEPGSVVVIDEANPGKLRRSTSAYDNKVAGIVSGANGINPGISMIQEDKLEAGENVALSGRVYVQADAAFGAIKPGDLLTTSDTPGHAMKVTEHGKAQGAILGKAMSGLKEGKGMVLVLVTLQ